MILKSLPFALLFGISASQSVIASQACNNFAFQANRHQAQTSSRKHVIAHTLVSDLTRGLKGVADQITSIGMTNPKGGDLNAVWVRDVFEVSRSTVREQVGDPLDSGRLQPRLLSYVNPFSPVAAPVSAAEYLPVKPPANTSPNAKPYRINNKIQYIESRFFPGLAEGGNIIWTKNYLITSEKTIQQNILTEQEFIAISERAVAGQDHSRTMTSAMWRTKMQEHAQREGEKFPYPSKESLIKTLSDRADVRKEHVLVLPWLPGEHTGHVDMYIGSVFEDVVAIAYIPNYAVSNITHPHQLEFAQSTNQFLHSQAERLASIGLEVVRIPMPAPINLQRNEYNNWNGDFLSTVNWVTKDGVVYVPIFESVMQTWPKETQTRFKEEITEKLASYGFTTTFINTDNLIGKKGGLHCLTADILP